MSEKIAVVGYSCRLPGGRFSELWARLCDGEDLVTEIPPDRWAVETYSHPSKSQPGTAYTARAGTIGDVSGFDAAFFGISPREAAQMDPQQRILLELAWEAFEIGGVTLSSVKGALGGVFLGFSSSDWSYRRADDLASFDATSMTGQTGSVAANRISYQLDLRGPSMAVDTACSSSLVAFHQACRSIQAGESEFALAGAITLHLHPLPFVGFARASMLSPRGVCNVFDARGDGYVRSEGGGMFLLKPLKKAIADGNTIYGVVAGTGVNCDGRTNGITVPGLETQTALLRDVYRRAGIHPSEVDYVEAHGTGTPVGDPIECGSIGMEIGCNRPKDAPLLIGSVKSNMGHLETASGVAGLAKAILCLQHRQVPPTINLNIPNPNLRLDDWNLRVVTKNTPLDPTKRLTIGVNSFGFGGANAHVVLQTADKDPVAAPGEDASDHDVTNLPLVVSGRGEAAVRAAAGQLAAHIEDHPDTAIYDIAYSAAVHRDWHPDRAIVFAGDAAAQLNGLKEFAGGGLPVGVVSGKTLANASNPVFVFSGNGSQWAGMGQDLLDHSEVFHNAVRAVDAIFTQYADFSILEELSNGITEQRLELTEVAQPALFAVQVGITEMLRDLGAEPAAMLGHSVGEVAAAWACGALTLKQAVRVIFQRSQQQGSTKGGGAMTAVGLGEQACGDLLRELAPDGRIVIAGINSPRGATVAGSVADLNRLEAALAEREVFYRRLGLDYAFHSPAMDPIRTSLERDLAGLKPSTGQKLFYSTVTGGRLPGNKLDAEYWWRNIREPVRFQGAIDALIADGYNLFVEIGPHAVLRTYINDCLRAASIEGRVGSTLQRDDGGPGRVQAAFYQLLVDGAPFDPRSLFPSKGCFVDIPTYPWQREHFWHPVTSAGYNLINRYNEHPLLGYRLRENDTEWENQLDTSRYSNLADHVVGDMAVFPAAGFVEMALAAADLWFGKHPRKTAASEVAPADFSPQEIEELEILAPLLLEDESARTVRFSIDPGDGRFSIRSRQYLGEDPWQLHVVGRLLGAPIGVGSTPKLRLPAREVDTSGDWHYTLTARVGLDYGPAYRSVTGLWLGDKQVTARLSAPQEVVHELHTNLLHPTFLDGCFQLLVDILRDEITDRGGVAFVPVKVGRLRLHRPGLEVSHARATLLRRSPRSIVANFELYDAGGDLVADLKQVRFRAVLLRRAVVEHTGYLRFESVPRPLSAPRSPVLPANGRLPAVCSRRLHEAGRVAARHRYYDEVEPLLDVLCAAFAQQALRRLCANHGVVAVEQLVTAGAVTSRFAPYLQNLVAMLQEDGVLEPAGEGLVWSSHTELPTPTSIWTSLLGDYPDYSAEILTLGRVGEHLSSVLSGELAAESLSPEDPEHPMQAHYFSGSPSVRAGNLAIVEMIISAVAALPHGERLRVLEFTRGRSQVAAQLLPDLDLDRCDFVLVSTDKVVLEGAEPLAERYPGIEIQLLDLGQSRPADHFDIVLLSQELAFAPDPDRLLQAMVGLMSPGGLLVVAEQPSSRWSEMVFGLRPDWWRSGTGRPIPKPRSAFAWSALLAQHGVTDVNVVHDLPDAKDGPYLLLGRASQALTISDAPLAASDACWLILQDAEGEGAVLADLLAARLRAVGQHPCMAVAGKPHDEDGDSYSVSADDAKSIQRMLERLRESHGDPDGIVLLHGLPLGPTNVDAAGDRCVVAAELAKACAGIGIRPHLLLVTAGATADLVPGARFAPIVDAALWGFGRTLMNEFPDTRIRLVEVADPHDMEDAAGALISEMLSPDAEDEVIYASSGRFVPRLRTVSLGELASEGGQQPLDPHVARLDFGTPGPLKHLMWRPVALPAPDHEQVEIEVHSAGLNFRDIMYAMGLLSDEAVESGFAGPTLGMELAGVITAVGSDVTEMAVGDEVIAFAPASFAQRVVTPVAAVARKPAEWSFNAAATVPTTFFTAYYALDYLGKLEEGERLLIHGAAGGVGLAAIQLGKAMGAEIFATAGSDAKRDVVRLLGADHVMDSRSLAFADKVLELTDGEGVDVVLNSLAGEAINRNLGVLRPFGRFLELGKRDFYENTRIGLRPFRNNISYFGIDADQLMADRPALTRRLFGELMRLFEDGTLKPLPYRAFPAAQAVEAFRYMQQSRQIGKVVLDFEDGVGPLEVPVPEPLPFELSAAGTYLITGGMRGFGLETARWLAGKGARHLVLLSRRGAADEEAAQTIEALQREGVHVRAVSCDVADRAALAVVFDDIAKEMPPVRGIVHAAMVIDDGLVRSLSPERIRKVLAPKILGAHHLDELSRDLELDIFVLYSSVTTLFGNPGQASYVAANRYLEALAHARRTSGLPAVCVSWGAIDDVGYLARNSEIKEALQSRMGGAALTSAEALHALEHLLARDFSGLGVMELDWNALRRFLPTALSPKYQDLAQRVEEASADAEGLEQVHRWLEEMDDDELSEALCDALKKEVGEILHVSPERIEDDRSLYDLGMDSLMGMELVAAVEARFGVTLPVMALSEGLTVARLVENIVHQLRAPHDGDEDDTRELVTRIAMQHASADETAMIEDVAMALDSKKSGPRSLTDS